jgi:hypothetical protein
VIAVLVFVALFGAPWPDRFALLWPANYEPWQQILVGGSIIVLHGLFGKRRDGARDEESADASYFLGFIMTLLFLVFGLMASGRGIDAAWVSGFIADLGVGLSFTGVGLTVRQLLVLTGARGASDANVRDAAQRLAAQLDAVQAAADRIEGSLAGVSQPVRELAKERMAGAVIGFESRVGEATAKLSAAIDDLTSATVRSAVQIEGASSGLRSALQQDLEALAHEVARVVADVSTGRERLFELMRSTGAQAEETQRLGVETARAQVTEWGEQLRATHAQLIGMRATSEEECRVALGALERSSGALVALSDAIVQRTNQLPDPSERLQALWGTIGAQEEAMVTSLTRASTALGSLERASLAVTDQMGRLDQSADGSARALSEGSGALRAALVKEVETMHRLVDELYQVIEGRINQVARH